jgi:ATP-dependent DNA helicase RecQ
VLLEHFGETPPFADGRCGRCDNCLRPPVEPHVEVADAPVPSAAARWSPGEQVTVPRHGRGEVLEATPDQVEVRFADGSTRTFVADYVRTAD